MPQYKVLLLTAVVLFAVGTLTNPKKSLFHDGKISIILLALAPKWQLLGEESVQNIKRNTRCF
jgi:hypothetical protein